MSDAIAIILSRARHPGPSHQEREKKILAGLKRRPGVEVTVLAHLYDLSPDGPGLKRLRSVGGEMIVLGWLYPRAIYWMLRANGVQGRLARTSSLPEEDAGEPDPETGGPERAIWCFDLRTHQRTEAYLEEIGRIVAAAAGDEVAAVANREAHVLEEPTRARWYPVIDYARCTNCLECLNFCLFGVYGLGDADSILIEQPDACRAGCPACSRICPEGAIMFPGHKDPAIAGDPKASLEGLKLDLSQLFAGASAAELAAGERARAMAEDPRHRDDPSDQAANSPDDLDQLVDELDDLDL